MIFRKPYAFFIKYFRLINFILTALLLIFMVDLWKLHEAVIKLSSGSTSNYSTLSNFVDFKVYLLIFIIALILIAMIVLLRRKEKPFKDYLFALLYNGILLVYIMSVSSMFLSIDESIVEISTMKVYRDISLIVIFPLIYFIVRYFLIVIGFNIKKFNFSKDIEELEIADKDSEEFEVLIGQNNYKYFRFIRRTLREIKYYILENKFAISVFASFIMLFFVGYGIYYYNQYMKKMGESEATSVNNITYSVRSSYITSRDFNGNEISDMYKYVVVDMSFYNTGMEAKSLNLDKITLANGDLVYYPILTRNQRFYDLGIPYNEGDMIPPGEVKNATLAFEIPKSVTTKRFSLRVEYELDASGANIISRYRLFDVNARQIDQKKTETKKNINETINTNVVDKNNFNLTVTGYSILDSFDNRYVKCQNINSCLSLSDVIKPSRINTETMLVVDFKGTVYEDANFTKTFNNYNKIFENYCTVSYVLFNKGYSTKAKVVTNSDVDGKVFIVMDRKLVNASEITLYFNFRDNQYEVPLLANSLT